LQQYCYEKDYSRSAQGNSIAWRVAVKHMPPAEKMWMLAATEIYVTKT
jgi:hypothetical protein